MECITYRKASCVSFLFQALPWSFKTKDLKSGEMIWTGYCVEFIAQISEMLNFDYELKEPKNGTFGKVVNGVWNGVIGDLVSGVSMNKES